MTEWPVVEPAPAKLNLALHVTGRRADGFHLLNSLVCFAALGDRVEIAPGAPMLRIKGPFADQLSDDPDNLCLRAAAMAGASVAIRLTKNLPVASGIGGGSADAAAVLRGLARLGHDLPPNPERLGADVPVCLMSAPTRMSGIGERLEPLPRLPALHLVLVNPGVAVPTPRIFAELTRRDNPPMPSIPSFADPDQLIAWLRRTRNDLEAPALRAAPVIAEVLAALNHLGAGFARMSGSGATCFGLYSDAAQAESAARSLAKNGWWAVATELAQPPMPG